MFIGCAWKPKTNTLSTKKFGAKNFGGNIFGGKNFGDLLPYFGVNFGENRKKIGEFFFGDFSFLFADF